MQQKARQTKNSKRMQRQLTEPEAIFGWPPLFPKKQNYDVESVSIFSSFW
jgi:hypothetical protein